MSKRPEEQDVPVMQLHGVRLVIRYLLLGFAALLFLMPLYWMIASSVKPEYQIFANPPVWWPNPPQWNNYREALTV